MRDVVFRGNGESCFAAAALLSILEQDRAQEQVTTVGSR